MSCNTFTTFALKPLVKADKPKIVANSDEKFGRLKKELADKEESEIQKRLERRKSKKERRAEKLKETENDDSLTNDTETTANESDTGNETNLAAVADDQTSQIEETKISVATADKLPPVTTDTPKVKKNFEPIKHEPIRLPDQNYSEVFVDPLVQWVLNGRQDDVNLVDDMVVLPGEKQFRYNGGHKDVLKANWYEKSSYLHTHNHSANASSLPNLASNLESNPNRSRLPIIDNQYGSGSILSQSQPHSTNNIFGPMEGDDQFIGWVLNGAKDYKKSPNLLKLPTI